MTNKVKKLISGDNNNMNKGDCWKTSFALLERATERNKRTQTPCWRVYFRMDRPVWFWVFGWFLTVAALVGNSLVIYLIASKRHLQTLANWLILSLAVADMFVGISYIPPLHACEVWFTCSTEVWLTRQTLQWFFLYSSVANLFMLTVDRYIAIDFPLMHKRSMTSNCVVLLVVTAWVLPFLIRVCAYTAIYLHSKKTAFKYVIPGLLFTFELVPGVLLPCFTLRIAYIARQSRRRIDRRVRVSTIEPRSPIRVQQHNEVRKTRSVRVVVTVVTLFVLCYSVEASSSICFIFDVCSVSTRLWNVRHILLVNKLCR